MPSNRAGNILKGFGQGWFGSFKYCWGICIIQRSWLLKQGSKCLLKDVHSNLEPFGWIYLDIRSQEHHFLLILFLGCPWTIHATWKNLASFNYSVWDSLNCKNMSPKRQLSRRFFWWFGSLTERKGQLTSPLFSAEKDILFAFYDSVINVAFLRCQETKKHWDFNRFQELFEQMFWYKFCCAPLNTTQVPPWENQSTQ